MENVNSADLHQSCVSAPCFNLEVYRDITVYSDRRLGSTVVHLLVVDSVLGTSSLCNFIVGTSQGVLTQTKLVMMSSG